MSAQNPGKVVSITGVFGLPSMQPPVSRYRALFEAQKAEEAEALRRAEEEKRRKEEEELQAAANRAARLRQLANKVFGTAELLENILLNLPHTGPNRDEWGELHDDSPWPFEPCMSLFTLQIVSKAFRDTIQGSTQLLKRMLLAPPVIAPTVSQPPTGMATAATSPATLPQVIKLPWPKHFPLVWLLKQMGCTLHDIIQGQNVSGAYSVVVNGTWECSRHIGTKPEHPFCGDNNTQASWRQVKICNATVPTGVVLELRAKAPGAYGWPEEIDVRWSLWPQLTLGEVFDGIQKLRQDSLVHKERAVMIAQQRREEDLKMCQAAKEAYRRF